MNTTTTAFAKLLATGLAELRILEADKSVPKRSVRNFETSVSYNIRWMSLDGRLYDASEAAMKLFEGKVDLHQLRYSDQLKAERLVDPSVKKRSILKLEHKTCVSDIWALIKASDGKVETIEQILNSMQIVWVLVEEDNRLQRSKRGADHDAVYEAAGIRVVKNPVTS